ncbi:MAG: 3-oxoacid CoA-transferase subunit A [Chloroflexi bacterium]|nr:3-oxoacid CoA-transferase subunit A [Chloroflexota bacterium]
MDKVMASPADAIADLAEGASIAIAGFGLSHRFPSSLLAATRDKGTKNLCLVCNSLGAADELRAQMLVNNGQVNRLIVSFSARPGMPSRAEELIAAGEVSVELVPQGTLVERLRAGGAGLAAFFTPTGAGTPIAAGKEVRYFDGKPYVLETALRVDYAFLRAHRADRMGNLQVRGGSQNFNPSFATGARVAIAEVDEIVEVGEIPPDQVGLPGVFISRVVKSTVTIRLEDVMPTRRSRPADVPRQYGGKPGLTRAAMARRAAELLPEGSVVNLGIGIPTLVSNYLADRDVQLHAENGVLGYGKIVTGDEVDPDVYNAGGQFVSLRPGASFFDSVTSFEIARSGKLHAVILGAYQVDARGNLANWSTPEQVGGGIGGAMDLVAGASTVIIIMEHRDSRDRPKLVQQCAYPLTAIECVDVVITDLALLRRRDGVMWLDEVAPGFTAEEVLALTDMDVKVAPTVGVMKGDEST